MEFELLAQDGRVLCAMDECCLCDRVVRVVDMDVFEGPGQTLRACVPCVVDLDAHCSADPGQPLPWELGADVDADREVA